LLGVIVYAADIQDADGADELLKRLKRLYHWNTSKNRPMAELNR
jgi:hypothetical protein